MKFALSTLFALFLIVSSLPAGAENTPKSGSAVNPRAEKVEQVFAEIESNHQNGDKTSRTYRLTDTELNAYLQAQLREQEQPGVEQFSVSLVRGGFVTLAKVDTNELSLPQDSASALLLYTLFSGKQTLEAEGDFQARNGKGVYRVRWAKLNGRSIPPSIANGLLSSMGKKQEPPFDPTEPFEMPWGIDSVDCHPDYVTIRTGTEPRP